MSKTKGKAYGEVNMNRIEILEKRGWKWDDKRDQLFGPFECRGIEHRERMGCREFRDRETRKTTRDVNYETVSIKDFLEKSRLQLSEKWNQADIIVNDKCGYNAKFFREACLYVKNAEICYPEKEAFPLIIRNSKYNYYISPVLEGEIPEECQHCNYYTSEYRICELSFPKEEHDDTCPLFKPKGKLKN